MDRNISLKTTFVIVLSAAFIIPIVIFLYIIFVYGSLNLSPVRFKSIFILAENYHECTTFSQFNTKYFIGGNRCILKTAKNNILYLQCIAHKGEKTEKVCALCPGCECIPAGCQLTYINPEFQLPNNYLECQKKFGNSGSAQVNGVQKKLCTVIVTKKGASNSNKEDIQYNECLQQGGRTTSDNDTCVLDFQEE